MFPTNIPIQHQDRTEIFNSISISDRTEEPSLRGTTTQKCQEIQFKRDYEIREPLEKED